MTRSMKQLGFFSFLVQVGCEGVDMVVEGRWGKDSEFVTAHIAVEMLPAFGGHQANGRSITSVA